MLLSSVSLRLCLSALLCACAVLGARSARAWCTPNKFPAQVNPLPENAEPIPFGRINLGSEALQPFGSLLASVSVPPQRRNLSPETVLWTCDLKDLDKLHFLVATNGDSSYSGHTEIGQPDGLKDVYATWFPHIGLRQTMDGVPVTRKWTKVPLKDVQRDGNKLHIRLKDFPTLQAELYRVSEVPRPFLGVSCEPMGKPSAAGTAYGCRWPNAYVQFVGPDIPQNNAGNDSKFVPEHVYSGFGYRLYGAMRLSEVPSCVVHSATPQVRFPALSVAALEAGNRLEQTFSVRLMCSQGAKSGTASGQGHTAISLQASPGAIAAAKRLGMVNPNGGMPFLLSDHYDTDPTLAKGVGIAMYGEQGTPYYFASRADADAPTDEGSGWYPFRQDARVDLAHDNQSLVEIKLTAALMRLSPEQQVTPGKINATARIVVKVP